MFRKLIPSLLLIGCFSPAMPRQIVIKMGTLAPEGSPWHQVLLETGEKWRKITSDGVKLVIYPGGNLGDEPDMVKRMRINQIQAAALTGVGLAEIEPGIMCLQIPLMFQSYEELDYVRSRVAPKLEKLIEARGFLILSWGDAGWVHFFTKTPAPRLDDLRKLKLFTWAGGDNEELELWKANRFRPVPLAATDILTGLQTGLIEAVPTTALYALWNQCFGLANNMTDVKWAALVGATVVKKSAWEKIPEAQRSAMYKAALESSDRLRQGIRKMCDDAVAAMQKRKLNIVHVDAAAVEDWRKQTEAVYPRLRGRTVPADLFDEVRRLRDEFRSQKSGRGK
jgi:TRAP-type transport system periplasmic protein